VCRSFCGIAFEPIPLCARRPLDETDVEMRSDLALQDRNDLSLFISASMEGMTVFAGHEKPFEPRMPTLAEIAIRSFINLVCNYRPSFGTENG